MTAPFWLLIFVWTTEGVAVSHVPMPTLEACVAARDELPAFMSTSVRGACIPGGTGDGRVIE
jgi:hypothetical protein